MVISGHNLIRVRRQTTPTIPTSCFFTIPEEYKTCHVNHDRLLLHDSDDLQSQINNSLYSQPEGRVLIWSSDVQLNLLFSSKKLYMDGTFASAPPYFNQLFIIHSIHQDSCTFFVFLSNVLDHCFLTKYIF